MRILIFGTGCIYQKMKRYLSEDDEIVAFLDNNQKLWGSKIDNRTIYSPINVLKFHFNKIVLMSDYAYEMKIQLLKLGCSKEKILHYIEYIEAQSGGEMRVLFPRGNRNDIFQKRCLIITTELGYNGGSIAAVYAALALQKKGYETVIAAPGSDLGFLEEARKKGFSIIIYKNLNHAKERELFWVRNFLYVIVNTLQMSCCAVEIAKSRKVVLWLHEPHIHYKWMRFWIDEIQEGILTDNLKVFAVSDIAKKNFLANFYSKPVKILPYGILDEYIENQEKIQRKFTFAMIGLINVLKGQDIFLDAVKKMGTKGKECSFLIIGRNLKDDFGQMIEDRANKNSNICMLGEIPHEQIIRYLQSIDVLIVASREDMLPIVATEAMMLKKVCIISDAVGTRKYIKDFYSGLIFSLEDSNKLAEKMIWCLEHRVMLKEIGVNAREVYDKNFSMKVFGNNLENVLCENGVF